MATALLHNRVINAGGGLISFDYTGEYALLEEEAGWKIRFLSSGTLTMAKNTMVDIFAVGGGGNGFVTSGSQGAGGGGGGGYTNTVRTVELPRGDYIVTIGAATGTSSLVRSDGDVLCSAAGGKSGTNTGGGGGGSGGAVGAFNYNNASAPGSNGANGGDIQQGMMTRKGGTGQGTTTREFGEETGALYAGGGGGGSRTGAYLTSSQGLNSLGAEGGGGDGACGGGSSMYAPKPSAATPGEPNTGGGGGGGSTTTYNGAAGGTGIVIIRNARG